MDRGLPPLVRELMEIEKLVILAIYFIFHQNNALYI